ncbi:hypothetical protein SAMN05444408_11433 [Chryseobacterium takakiae]|uniref:Phage protein n=1 Tax=Chryseobacterium takakiae TaxID=1302685 RepID=A0A1M5AMS6_9FLAO|nr:hypothetical protein SAMN05444408_11433 [Chryseobacterium takakiae]
MAWKLYYPKHKNNNMKSRILKAVVAVVAPLVIEFVIKKIAEKFDEKPAEDKKRVPVQNWE